MRQFSKKILIVALLAAATMGAQEPESGPDGSSKTSVPGITILAIPGKPFSGVDNIEWTTTGADGTVVTKHLQAALARDSQGRIYREHHSFVPGNSQDPAPLNSVHVSDPTTRTQMTCYLRAFVCDVYAYDPKTTVHASTIGAIDNGAKFRTREMLGRDQYLGLDVTRSREVTTTRAGAEGNDRDIVETREFWYSEALQGNLKVARTGPLAGKQVVYMTDISLSEPNPDWFRVPVGYKVRDMRHVRSTSYLAP